MGIHAEEKLPQIVDERLQEAYDMIRKGEVRQMKRRTTAHKKWLSVAAVFALVMTIPSVVFATVVYFQKNVKQGVNEIVYDFTINYELVPGEYQVEAGYVPKGYIQDGEKFRASDEEWITVMPIYTMAELERINGQITVNDIERVEHTFLSGMEADVITFMEAKKFQRPTYIFLFNERDGYVVNIIAGYGVGQKELLQFADSLDIERIGDGNFESDEEKAARQEAEEDAAQLALESEKTWDALVKMGIPSEKVSRIGEEMNVYDGFYQCGYTVTGYEFMDSIEGFGKEGFFDYGRFDGWLNNDQSLKPYTRLQYDEDGNVIAEAKALQKVLRVDITVHNYSEQPQDVPLDFALQYVEERQDGTYTWSGQRFAPVPEEGYELQMDESAVYLDKAVNTRGEERSHFFYRELGSGEELGYTLLFIVDADREDSFLLYRVGSNNSIWQTESNTVKEIRDALDGYIRLQP